MPEQHNMEWKTCPSLGYPAPHFEVLGDDLTVTFSADASAETVQASGESKLIDDRIYMFRYNASCSK